MLFNESFRYVNDLVLYAEANLHLPYEDIDYCMKCLCHLLNLEYTPHRVTYDAPEQVLNSKNARQFIDPLAENAVESGRFRNKRLATDAIMACVCPFPSKINEMFDYYYANEGAEAACNYLYSLCKRMNYELFDRASDNHKWVYESEKGKLEITIDSELDDSPNFYKNIDSKELESNFLGRCIPIILNDNLHHFQYLPSKCIDGHFIMYRKIAAQDSLPRISVLMDFVDMFPNYFICVDEDIPGFGHFNDCYQGGEKTLPLFGAPQSLRFSSTAMPDVRLTVPDWYLSVIRLESANKQSAINAVCAITDLFENYSDKAAGLTGTSDEVSFNRVKVIARMNNNGEYTADLLLFNEYKESKSTAGMFGTSEDLLHIRRVPISTLNAAGAIILPGRLVGDAHEIKDFVIGRKKLSELADPEYRLGSYAGMIAQLINDNGTSLSEPEAETAIEGYINKACVRLLKCSQVFNTDDKKGLRAIIKFINSFGFEQVNI